MNKYYHPIDLIQDMIIDYKQDPIFEFSIYKPILYKTNKGQRTIINICGTKLTSVYLNETSNIIQDTKIFKECDLTINSKVILNDKLFHIPLIDFKGKLTLEKVSILKNVLDKKYSDNLYLFNSGNSLHGYIPILISEEEWIKFMGSLLLLNYKYKEPISDTRWIGHRLISGYSALRWTSNDKKYKHSPIGIGWLKDM